MTIEIPTEIYSYGYADDQAKVQSAIPSKYAYLAAIAAVVFIIVLIILFAKKKN